MRQTRESSVSTRLEQNEKKAWEYLSKIVGTPYARWMGGIVPSRAPIWRINGEPPPAAAVRGKSCFCAGVSNLTRRAVGLEIPHLNNENYDGGVVARFGTTDAASPESPPEIEVVASPNGSPNPRRGEIQPSVCSRARRRLAVSPTPAPGPGSRLSRAAPEPSSCCLFLSSSLLHRAQRPVIGVALPHPQVIGLG